MQKRDIAPFPIILPTLVFEWKEPFTKNRYRYMSPYDFYNLGTENQHRDKSN